MPDGRNVEIGRLKITSTRQPSIVGNLRKRIGQSKERSRLSALIDRSEYGVAAITWLAAAHGLLVRPRGPADQRRLGRGAANVGRRSWEMGWAGGRGHRGIARGRGGRGGRHSHRRRCWVWAAQLKAMSLISECCSEQRIVAGHKVGRVTYRVSETRQAADSPNAGPKIRVRARVDSK